MSAKKNPVILVMNGPNLNMLGKRKKQHYGSFTLEQVEIACKVKAESLGVECVFFQSNEEGALVSEIHKAMEYADGIVINAGAYTHYSYAILDAIELCGIPVVEVHISNIYKRESFRQTSVIHPVCVDQVYGLGMDSYLVGLEKLVKEHILSGKNGTAPEMGGIEDLEDLRNNLTRIDGELMDIYNRRMELSRQVGKYKQQSGTKAVYDAKREEEVIDMARQRADAEIQNQAQGLMKTVLRTSRERQYAILLPEDRSWEIGKQIRGAKDSLSFAEKVVYAGAQGSYSEMAAHKLFPTGDIRAIKTFSEAWEEVQEKRTDIAVLPAENTTVGTVDDVYGLLQAKDMFIVSAASVRIYHKLAVLPGTDIADIRTVVSHPQAISQCSEEIRRRGWGVQTTGNTAFAPREVALKGDPSVAAIASEEAALRGGLMILPVEISNSPFNQTRFVALSSQPVITPRANRISLFMHLSHSSGSLAAALEIFSDYGLNLCSIFSRPIPDTPWEYAFFLDFMAEKKCEEIVTPYTAAGEQNVLPALYQLVSEMPYVKFLGWYEDIG